MTTSVDSVVVLRVLGFIHYHVFQVNGVSYINREDFVFVRR